MADDRIPSPDTAGADAQGRGGRTGGPREAGGFRIRLSDNEMQAARALQEAFGLRSTVAVLGFSLRAMAQQLEQGQLDELIAQQRAQGGARPGGDRSPERRRDRGEGRDSGRDAPRGGRPGRVDPFARPSRPAPGPAETEAAESEAAEFVATESEAAEFVATESEAAEPSEPISAAAAEPAETPAETPAESVPEASSAPHSDEPEADSAEA